MHGKVKILTLITKNESETKSLNLKQVTIVKKEPTN